MSKMVFRSKIEQAIPELEPFKGPMQGLYIFKNLAKIENLAKMKNVESLHGDGWANFPDQPPPPRPYLETVGQATSTNLLLARKSDISLPQSKI